LKLYSALKVTEQYSKPDLYRILTAIDTQVNNLMDGRISALRADSVMPTSSLVPSAIGDEVRNLNATVQGTVGSQYVVRGWICTTGGTPGIWREQRSLTGT